MTSQAFVGIVLILAILDDCILAILGGGAIGYWWALSN